MSNVRLRRLNADFQKLSEYARLHPRITLVQADGDPPERYQLQYRIRSLRSVNGELEPIKDHTVEILLPRNYPRTPPQCRMLSPVFHPNIAPHAICVGDHWSAGESLQSIVTRIGEMLAYQSYNVKSPLNGEAARWVEENKEDLPLDRVSLLVDEKKAAARESSPALPPRTGQRRSRPTAERSASPAPRPSTPVDEAPIVLEPAPETIRTTCPECESVYEVKSDFLGRKVRCKRCKTVFAVT